MNRKVRYYLEDSAGGMFEIAPESGLVRLAGSLDRETIPLYTLRVKAVDQGSPQLYRETTLYVNVLDVNDNPPQVRHTKQHFYSSRQKLKTRAHCLGSY